MPAILPRDLNPKQLEAATHPGGPLLITAGAGSGKTKTLTSRLLYLLGENIAPESIIAITFTNKAAAEMKERAERLITEIGIGVSPPFIGTFHSFGARILRSEAPLVGRTRGFSVYDEDDAVRLIKKILKAESLDQKKYPYAVIRHKISKVKNELENAEEDEDEVFSRLFSLYESALRDQNAFDFDDLIYKPVYLFENTPGILNKYESRYRHILVDEYQDINTAQYRLVRLLAGKHRNLSVVGDDHQSIYGFRWSDFRNFLNFEKDWPEAKVVILDQNYRSTKTIVSAASAVIEQNRFQRPKTLWTENDEGSPIKVAGFSSPESEAEWIVSSIKDPASSAILYRTNAQSRPIEQALIMGHIPYMIFGGLRFYDRKEIKDIVACLRLAMNPLDEMSRDRLLKEFRKTKIRPVIEELPHMGEICSPVELIGYILKETDYIASLKTDFKNAEERIENISELISFAGNFDSLPELVERISLLQSTDQPRGDEDRAVRLMTVHMAKGLEFDDVFLAGVSDGILPHERSLFKASDLEEERRLMYVAMTRAKKSLRISFFRTASRFLYEIPPELVEFSDFKFGDEDTIYLD
ncbi:MAG: UvrD-helicase domain-containing protein [Candidatus Colwellbacteria bacterium]|nr:UvrD-helicase domain-containing protein [Candidatus Colwellbacteria bacterium]